MKSNIHFAVISHKRSQNIQKMEQLTDVDLTWYVGEDEKEDYASVKGKVIEGGKLVPSRNKALDTAFNQKKYCCMIDDDLQVCEWINDDKTKKIVPFTEMADELYKKLSTMPMYLAGIAPTQNTFFYNKPLSIKNFVKGSLILVKPTPLRFDNSLQTKEDYDYTLQHIQKYGGVCRLNYLIPKFLHYGNKGGIVDTRTTEMEQDSIAKLKKKWGRTVRDNPRRKNEILLHVK